jgi:hypothetical protein
LHGYDVARAIEADRECSQCSKRATRRSRHLAHEIRTYAAEDIRFGMRYTDAVTTARDGTPVLDLTKIGALEPDVGDRQEQGWTEREEARE